MTMCGSHYVSTGQHWYRDFHEHLGLLMSSTCVRLLYQEETSCSTLKSSVY